MDDDDDFDVADGKNTNHRYVSEKINTTVTVAGNLHLEFLSHFSGHQGDLWFFLGILI